MLVSSMTPAAYMIPSILQVEQALITWMDMEREAITKGTENCIIN